MALWVTAESREAGDGLFLLQPDWTRRAVNHVNNTTAICRGSFGGATVLYVSHQEMNNGISVYRRTAAADGAETIVEGLNGVAYVGDLAAVGDTLFATVERLQGGPFELWRVDPHSGDPNSARVVLQERINLVLAEGSTDAGLFALKDGRSLGTIDLDNGTFEEVAWSDPDEPDWVWRSVSAPRTGHKNAGQLIVLESNRMLDMDRLLLITPPPKP
jgi:hypothetical protein